MVKRWLFPTVIFCYQFMTVAVNVTLPFYAQTLTADPVASLRWTGWMLGVVPLMVLVTTPVWMRWANGNPRVCYIVSQTLQGCGFVGMVFARSFPVLFGTRWLIGVAGPSQSLALVIVSRAGGPHVRWIVSAIQSATALATAIAPLGATVLTSIWGLSSAFLVAGLVIGGCGLAALWSGPLAPVVARPQTPGRRNDMLLPGLLVFIGYAHVYILTAILPQVIPPLGVDPSQALAVGGWILLGGGIALTVGSMGAIPLSERLGERRTVGGCVVVAAGCLVALGFATDPITFGLIRCVEIGCIAPIMVLGTARAAQSGSSQAIGWVNSSRVLAIFAGPIIATHLLSTYSLSVVFVILAVASLACLPVIRTQPIPASA